MALIAAILLLMVSATCEGYHLIEEQKLISSQLRPRHLQSLCQDIGKNYCKDTRRNSFVLQTRRGVTYKKVWLESIENIIQAILNIYRGKDLKETYQSIINATFNALNDLLNDYYEHDNKIKDLSPIAKILGEIEHRIHMSFPITEEITLLIEIIKDFILLSKSEFKDLIKIKSSTEKIVAFNRAIRYDAVTFNAYQPLLMNLTELLIVVSTKGYNSTSLRALMVVLNNTINEIKNIVQFLNKVNPFSDFDGTIKKLTSVLTDIVQLWNEVKQSSEFDDSIKKIAIVERDPIRKAFADREIVYVLREIMKDFVVQAKMGFKDLIKVKSLIKKSSAFLEAIRSKHKNYNTYRGLAEHIFEFLRVVSIDVYNSKILTILRGKMSLISLFFQWTYNIWIDHHISSRDETNLNLIYSLQEIDNEYQERGYQIEKKINKDAFESWSTYLNHRRVTEQKSKLVNIIKNFITEIAQNPTKVNTLEDFHDEIIKLKDLEVTVNESLDVKEFLTLLENLIGVVKKIVTERPSIDQSKDVIKRVINVLEELNTEIQRTSYDLQNITNINKAFDKLIEISKNSLDQIKQLNEKGNRIINIFKGFISVLAPNPKKVETLNELLVELTKLKEDLKTIKGNEDVKEVLKLIENLTGFVQKLVSSWTYFDARFDVPSEKVIILLEGINGEIKKNPKDVQKIIQKINESFDKRIEIIMRPLNTNKNLADLQDILFKVIDNFITVLERNPSEDIEFHENHFFFVLTKFKEDLKATNVMEVVILLDNLFGFYGEFLSEWTNVYQSPNFNDTRLKAIYLLIDLKHEINRNLKDLVQIIRQINESFNKRIEIIKSSMATTKQLIDTRNIIISIMKSFITLLSQKQSEVKTFKYYLDKLTTLKEDLKPVKENEHVKEVLKLLDNLFGLARNIGLEWTNLYQSSIFDDTIKNVTIVLQEITTEIQISLKDYMTIITKINESFDKRIEIIKSSMATNKQLIDTEIKIINIMKSFISVLPKNQHDFYTFTVYRDVLITLKEDLKTVKGNEDVKEVLKLLDNLFGIVQTIELEWTNLYQSSNFDDTIKNVTIYLEEITRKIQSRSKDFQTIITQINKSFDKQIIISSMATINLLIDTRNKTINLIKSFISELAQNPSEVKKINNLIIELTKLKEDLKTVKGNEDVKEVLKLLENLTGFVQKIVSEWTNIYQSLNFVDIITQVTDVLEEITRDIQSSSKDFQTKITKIKESFDKRIEIIKSSMATIKQLIDTKNQISYIIKSFISVLTEKPTTITYFNDLFSELTKLKEDLTKLEGKKDVQEVLKLLDNFAAFFQKIVSEWTNIKKSPLFDDLIKKLTIDLEEINREIKRSSHYFQTIAKINESFDKRLEILKSSLAQIKQQFELFKKIINIINSFFFVLTEKPYEVTKFNDLFVELKNLKEDLKKLEGNNDVEEALKLLDNFAAFFQKIVSEWTNINQAPGFDDIIKKVTIDIEELNGEIKRSSNYFQTITKINESFDKRLEIINSLLAQIKQQIETTNKIKDIFKNILNLAKEEDTSLNHFNTLISEIKSLYDGRAQNNELKKEIEKIYNAFKALTPIIKVNKDSKIEETFIRRFRQLVKGTWLAVIDNKLLKDTDVFLAHVRRLIDETEKKVFSDGFKVFQDILKEFCNLSREHNPTLSRFQDALNIIKIYDEEIIQSKSNQSEDLKSLTQSLYTLFKDFVFVLESKQNETKAYHSFVVYFKVFFRDCFEDVSMEDCLEEIGPKYNEFATQLRDVVDVEIRRINSTVFDL